MSETPQPQINIGMVGHVDHGKTTLTKAFSGIWTDRHSEELRRGISIKLGYADALFYTCTKCSRRFASSAKARNCPECSTENNPARVVSFVDAPGHETLMAIMITGASIMDGAMLLVAANEKCPQPQTQEHLMALELSGIKNVIIVQNKIDLVDDRQARENYDEIKQFVAGTNAESAPIIPVSAHHDVNIDVLIEAIETIIPTPDRDLSEDSRMYIARSFDVNKPGRRPGDLLGGVIGGSIVAGKFEIGDELEISPGLKDNKWQSIHTEAVELISGNQKRETLLPGGLASVGTNLDPYITKGDSLAGKVAGKPGTLPPLWDKLNLETFLLDRIVGGGDEDKVDPLSSNERLMLNVATATTVGVPTNVRSDEAEMKLQIPVCAMEGQRVAMSRRVAKRWRLIGYGIIK